MLRGSHIFYWHRFAILKFSWSWWSIPLCMSMWLSSIQWNEGKKSGNSLLLLKESWRRDSHLLPLITVVPAWQKTGTLEDILQPGRDLAENKAEMLGLAQRKDASNLDTNSGICTVLNVLLKYSLLLKLIT